jgi:hypothetical protein
MQVAVLELFIFSKIEFLRRLVGSVYIFAGRRQSCPNPSATIQILQFTCYKEFVSEAHLLKRGLALFLLPNHSDSYGPESTRHFVRATVKQSGSSYVPVADNGSTAMLVALSLLMIASASKRRGHMRPKGAC